jgi:serine/threonine protein kinase
MGGMGWVYRARHEISARCVALKILREDQLAFDRSIDRMMREATILASVAHPGIPRFFECGMLDDGRPWIAMELVEGETLANKLHYAETLSALDVATLLTDVADVLAAVHRTGVVHRDLKPDNLLCTPTDRDYALRVLDWGVARLGPLGRLTVDGMTPGTPIYMSPEQATGHNIGPACDIYSLGVIAYEALTGAPPFDGRSLAEVVCMHLTRKPAPLEGCCDAPRELRELVKRMLEKDPALRPGAIEVRQIARAVALELTRPYEAIEIVDADDARHATRCRSVRPAYIASDEDAVADADSLEYGVTEMLPVVPRPRWTPEIVPVQNAIVAGRSRQVIGPRSARDQVAGEIIASVKHR